jgi:hypothetical protein
MAINKIILVTLLFVITLPIISCINGSPAEIPITRNVAIMIAAANVPSSVSGNADVVTLWDNSKWTVYFSLTKTVTKEELGWPESPDTTFVNGGSLPLDTYRLLVFTIDRRTGGILSRYASDSLIFERPGILNLNTEPTGIAYLPLWSTITSGIVGFVIGGIFTWLVMRRKKIIG